MRRSLPAATNGGAKEAFRFAKMPGCDVYEPRLFVAAQQAFVGADMFCRPDKEVPICAKRTNDTLKSNIQQKGIQ